MESDKLQGARAKVKRAIDHFNQIDAAIGEIFIAERDSDSTATPSYEYIADRQELIILRPQSAPVDSSLSLMVGDCIHNARSALDHLVYQLAILNGASDEAASKTSFPIYLTPRKFKNGVGSKIAPFISDTALAEIEKLQPYAAGNAGEEDVSWVLSQLDIVDKHRLLIVTKSKVRVTAFAIKVPTGHVFSEEVGLGPWHSAEAGTELFRFDLSRAIKEPGKMEVKIESSMSIQIEQTGLVCDGMILLTVLSDCINFVGGLIDSFGKTFFGE